MAFTFFMTLPGLIVALTLVAFVDQLLLRIWTLRRAAERFQVSPTTAQRWAGRYRELGEAGMADRSSRPHHSLCRTPTRTVKLADPPLLFGVSCADALCEISASVG